jgi:hypothetical protein
LAKSGIKAVNFLTRRTYPGGLSAKPVPWPDHRAGAIVSLKKLRPHRTFDGQNAIAEAVARFMHKSLFHKALT